MGNKRRDFKSEFDEQERFEDQEMERTGRKPGDQHSRKGLGDLSMVQRAQRRNLDRINSKGIGHTSKEAKKPSWEKSDG